LLANYKDDIPPDFKIAFAIASNSTQKRVYLCSALELAASAAAIADADVNPVSFEKMMSMFSIE